jgi:hypothetical protein
MGKGGEEKDASSSSSENEEQKDEHQVVNQKDEHRASNEKDQQRSKAEGTNGENSEDREKCEGSEYTHVVKTVVKMQKEVSPPPASSTFRESNEPNQPNLKVTKNSKIFDFVKHQNPANPAKSGEPENPDNAVHFDEESEEYRRGQRNMQGAVEPDIDVKQSEANEKKEKQSNDLGDEKKEKKAADKETADKQTNDKQTNDKIQSSPMLKPPTNSPVLNPRTLLEEQLVAKNSWWRQEFLQKVDVGDEAAFEKSKMHHDLLKQHGIMISGSRANQGPGILSTQAAEGQQNMEQNMYQGVSRNGAIANELTASQKQIQRMGHQVIYNLQYSETHT